MKSWAIALTLAVLLAPAAGAVRPPSGGRADAKRFGFEHPFPAARKTPTAATRRAFADFQARSGGKWSVRYNPRTGLPAALLGGRESAPAAASPEETARRFLSVHADVLGVDPRALTFERRARGVGHQHLLFRQSYRGLSVEGAAVKVHLDSSGAVTGVHSSFEPDLAVPTTPSVSPDAAARAARADAGAFARSQGTPELVILPLEKDGRNHLAWKLRVGGAAGAWRYFVDAVTGQVLLRYSTLRYITPPCQSSGVVTGMVYDIDPSSTPGPGGKGFARPFNNQYVYVAQGVQTLTGGDPTFGQGFFCSGVPGKVAMSLQGPWVSVGEFRGPNAHYDDGSGVWTTLATPVSSPHPYAANSVAVSTIDLSAVAPNAVSFLPVFGNFKVGAFDGGSAEGSGDISQDDQLFIYDGRDNPVSAYIGNRAPFNGAEVHGQVMHLAIEAKSGGTNTGFDIAISSYLTLTNPTHDNAPYSSHTWTNADTSQNLHSEINLFYHLNQMHDYFLSDVDKSSAAPVVKPAVAMAHVGPNLINAFYDPDYDALYFGDVNSNAPSDMFADDATVPRHEYVHYLVEKIWSIQNYGQAGAISEANADYFSASSLDDTAIGAYVMTSLGAVGMGPNNAMRELDCHKQGYNNPYGNNSCYILGNPATPWNGEIHDDSPFVSQALWEIRANAVARLGHAAGRSCADGLEFQALLGFPESFTELYESLLHVDQIGAVAACGGAGAMSNAVTTAFNAHGLISAGGDGYEPNDGFETAVDISTIGTVSATIYPAADTDFFSFGAGPGLVQITLKLPSAGGGIYKAYQLKLYDVSRRLVAGAAPPYNGPFTTVDGICNTDDCGTTSGQVQLNYNNPAGGLLFVQVVGGDSANGSNSGVNSATPYVLGASFQRPDALSGAVVSAKFDKDVIGFTVNSSTFVSRQDWSFAYAQLRDQSLAALPNTLTHAPSLPSDWLAFVSSSNAGGLISGSVQLVPGFASRFPSVGTVSLEVFGYDVHGSTASMGISNPLDLSANQTELTAYNNVFNPLLGQKATVKYAVSGAGHLSVKLYTITGRLVRTLFDGDVAPGKGSVDWPGVNSAGNAVASGIYVVRAVGPGLDATQKIAVVK